MNHLFRLNLKFLKNLNYLMFLKNLSYLMFLMNR